MSPSHYVYLWLAIMLLFCGVLIIVHDVIHSRLDARTAFMIGLLSILIAMFIGMAISR